MVRPKQAPSRKKVQQELNLLDFLTPLSTLEPKKKKNENIFKNASFHLPVVHTAPAGLQLLGHFAVEMAEVNLPHKLHLYVSTDPSKCFFYSHHGNKEFTVTPVRCHFPFAGLHALTLSHFTAVLSASTIHIYLQPAAVHDKFPCPSSLSSSNQRVLANSLFGTQLLEEPDVPPSLDIADLYSLLSNQPEAIVSEASQSSVPVVGAKFLSSTSEETQDGAQSQESPVESILEVKIENNEEDNEVLKKTSALVTAENNGEVKHQTIPGEECHFSDSALVTAENNGEVKHQTIPGEECHFSDSSQEESTCMAANSQDRVEGILNLLKEEVPNSQPTDVQHPYLKPTLRTYQVQAVRWMLNQELRPNRQVDLSSLFEILEAPDGNKLYYCKYLGIFLSSLPPGDLKVSGGILADEMGLGKTVEVLACMLNHPRPSEECSVVPALEVPKKKEVLEPDLPLSEVDKESLPRTGDSEGSENEEPPRKILATEEMIQRNKQNKPGNQAGTTRPKRSAATKVVNYRDLLGDDEDGGLKRKSSTKKKRLPIRESPDTRGGSARKSSSIIISSDSDDDFEPRTRANSKVVQSSDSSPDSLSSSEECFLSEKSKKKRIKKKVRKIKPQDLEENVSETAIGCHFECLCGNEFSRSSTKKLKRCCIECNHYHHANCIIYSGVVKKESLLCPTCWVDKYKTKPLKSKTTLIVVPDVILRQWESEVQKHVTYPGFRMFIYRRKPRSHHFISPASLITYDLILTTYEDLRAEFNYADISHSKNSKSRSLRTPKRFLCLPCPLLAVEWWRLCLDEAQMVESIATNTAEMALRLHSVHRWCVSGTPIQRHISDFYGLLLFLGAEPYSGMSWWQAMILRPYTLGNMRPLRSLMSHLFWRTAKRDVEDQLGLNPPREEIHWLRFSLVEKEFYHHQHKLCARDFRTQLAKLSQPGSLPLSSLDHHTISKIMLPLKRLREACSIPRFNKGHLINLSSSNNPIKDLLDSLIKKFSTECEEAHRQYISAINGMAAVHIMREEFPQAVGRYREALQGAEEHKENVKTDKLQQIHAMYNLTQVLEERQGDDSLGRTLRDDTYKERLGELRTAYLSKFQEQISGCQAQLQPATAKVKELMGTLGQQLWWLDLLDHCQELEPALVAKVKQELINRKGVESNTMAHMFRTISGLSQILHNKLENLMRLRKELMQQVGSYAREPTRAEVSAAADCHLHPEEGKKVPKCFYCKIYKATFTYEGSLYRDVPKNVARKIAGSDEEEGDDNLTFSGVWSESEAEVALKAILSFGQNAKASESLLKEGALHMKLFDALKKEFKVFRQYWGHVTNYVSAIDELDMATTRFRLRLPTETAESVKKSTYIYEPEELEPLMLKHSVDRASSLVEFKKKLGQFFYLQNLKKADYGKKGGFNTEKCPICLRELGMAWSMLLCGHSFCTECLQYIVQNQPRFFTSFKCPLCRNACPFAEVMQINTCPETSEPMSRHSIKGSHSTKVEGIIHCLHNILDEDPQAKVIIFTHWKLMVEVLTAALRENNITVTSWFEQQGILKFKDPESNIQALVLPISYGANGLNITEANHVVLAEPFINLASEQQAVGRIYRIGQARQTVVHRMVVWSTVEERIMEMLQPHRAKTCGSVKADGVPLTLAQLSDLLTEQK